MKKGEARWQAGFCEVRIATTGTKGRYMDFTPAAAPRKFTFACGVDNLRGLNVAQRAAAHAALLGAVGEHGADPCTRQQAAAHEIGHVLVGWAFGKTLLRTRIDACRNRAWTGETYTHLPGRDQTLRTTTADEDPSYAFRAVVDALGGIGAEIFAGLDHPASSLDEQVRAAAILGDLSIVVLKPVSDLANAAVALCLLALSSNTLQFDVLRAQLFAKRRLTGSAVAGVLARGTRFSWDPVALHTIARGNRIDLPPAYAALAARVTTLQGGMQ